MAFYMKGSPFSNGKENRQANKLRRQERRQRAKEIKDSGVSAEQYSFSGHESDMGKYDKKGRHKEFPEQKYSKKNPASNKIASDMMRTNFLGPLNQGFGGTPDSTLDQIREEEATNQLYAEGKITESNTQGTRRIKRRVKKLKRQEIRAIRKQNK